MFFEKPGTETKPGTAGWYNSAAFDKFAKAEGLYSKSINGDAFSHEVRDKAIELIREDMGQIDLVVEAGLQPYDIHAPIAVIEAAGGIVTNWQGGPAHAGGRVVAAANETVLAAALAILSKAEG